ncbi:hypothetical protein D9M70_627340 [compost metagenome]
MHRVPDRVIVGPQVILTDRADHDFTGMNAHADLQRNTLLQSDPVTMVAHGLLHAQRGKQCPQRMILVGDRRAE